MISLFATQSTPLLFINPGLIELAIIFAAVIVSTVHVFGLIHCIGNDDIPGFNECYGAFYIRAATVLSIPGG